MVTVWDRLRGAMEDELGADVYWRVPGRQKSAAAATPRGFGGDVFCTNLQLLEHLVALLEAAAQGSGDPHESLFRVFPSLRGDYVGLVASAEKSDSGRTFPAAIYTRRGNGEEREKNDRGLLHEVDEPKFDYRKRRKNVLDVSLHGWRWLHDHELWWNGIRINICDPYYKLG